MVSFGHSRTVMRPKYKPSIRVRVRVRVRVRPF